MDVRSDVICVCGIRLIYCVIAGGGDPIVIEIHPSARPEIRRSVDIKSKTPRTLIICIPISADRALDLWKLVLGKEKTYPKCSPVGSLYGVKEHSCLSRAAVRSTSVVAISYEIPWLNSDPSTIISISVGLDLR